VSHLACSLLSALADANVIPEKNKIKNPNMYICMSFIIQMEREDKKSEVNFYSTSGMQN
jgi:hypothetical protein